MDRASSQSAPAASPAPGHRDMMFCHECADEWYRDEHGLTCPECQSDFTEIIEENNDPRDSAMFADDVPDDNDSMPDLEETSPQLHPHHNPWANDDPDEDDISNVQFTQTAPGRYNVHATITRSMSPQQFRMAPGPIGGFMAMLNGLTRGAAQPQDQHARGQGEGLFSGPGQGQNQNQSAFQEAGNQGQGGQPRVSRFTYTGGTHMGPNDDIANLMAGVMAVLGPPGGMQANPHHHHGPGGEHNHDHDHDHNGQVHPAHHILQLLGMIHPGGQMGDFVSSQEGLDRIISQLMEQTATSNAPGPATQDDIDRLPRKTVDEEMLGAEFKAECSICMDEVNIGEEVTVLPCKHWFHHQCVSAWLLEHDTCPHCRKGITKQPEGQPHEASQDGASGGQASAGGGGGGQSSGSRRMPGAFDVSGNGTLQDPFVVPGDGGGEDTQAGSSGSADATSPPGGMGDRIRRGWFGPPQ